MPITLEPSDFLAASEMISVVDVRSPAEFAQGHIPGAISIPLFNDAERADVGTQYIQRGREEAILRGLDLILPKAGKLLRTIRRQVPGDRVLIYCWRGGLRSLNMAWLFKKGGYRVSILGGGYREYRRFARSLLGTPARIIIVGGYTGSGKTEAMDHMAAKGEQVIDLERLASHRGSAFGGIGLPEQPSNEQFENDLFDLWRRLDPNKFIWMEDESRMIGKVTLPDPIIRKIQQSPMMILDVPKPVRVRRLVRDYAGIDDRLLEEAVIKIGKRIGMSRVKEALLSIGRKEYSRVAHDMLTYYDKAYSFSIRRRDGQPMFTIPAGRSGPDGIAAKLISLAYTHLNNGTDLPGL